MNIVVIGSLAFDDVITKQGSVHHILGGSALYFSMTASLFVPVDVIGVVGGDFPREELVYLRSRGVNVDGVEIIKNGKTFRWAGEYETDMNIRRTTNLELNVFAAFNPVLDSVARKAPIVFLGNIDPDLQLNVLDQILSPQFIAADTIECYIESKPDALWKVIERINLLIINDSEARLLTGNMSLLSAAETILHAGPKYVIIKKGEHGSLLVAHDTLFTIPAFPMSNVIDPTGAGDSFAGGLMGYVARAQSWDSTTLKRAVVYGGIVASFAIEDFSIERLRTLTLDVVDARVSDFTAMTAF